jgi:hypothetical protein
MGKKSSLPLIYLIGMALVAIGFCVPMFKGLGIKTNGFDYMSFKNFGWTTIAALLIFCGAVLGVLFCFISAGKSTSLLRLICVIASIAGGVILFIKFNDNFMTKAIGKGFLKHAFIGFYMILVGWVLGLVGAITNK